MKRFKKSAPDIKSPGEFRQSCLRRDYAKFVYGLIILLAVLVWPPLPATATEDKAVSIDSGQAVITLLEGSVQRTKKGMVAAEQLFGGDVLSASDRVQTDKNSKVELKLPDGSYVRYDESTTFELVSAAVDTEKKQRNISVNMIIGKTWAKVARFLGGGRFTVSTRTAVAGVRGTVYRLNVNPDNSVAVKVYRGEVVVNSLPKAQATAQPGKITAPAAAAGPHPVPGPHPVSLKEWTYIVKSLEQINILPDGTVEKPFRFDIKKDLDDWVLWNQQRDQTLGDI
jgi:ferric-dicitrate binding protein FerR (iron transport regulator)